MKWLSEGLTIKIIKNRRAFALLLLLLGFSSLFGPFFGSLLFQLFRRFRFSLRVPGPEGEDLLGEVMNRKIYDQFSK
jgi:hypothetical protein